MDRVRVMQVVMENIAKHIVHQTKGLFAREEVLYIMCSKSCEGDVFFFRRVLKQDGPMFMRAISWLDPDFRVLR
jgi:hypothetical protein